MPTVPRYSPQADQARTPTVRIDPNQPIETFGGGAAAAAVPGAIIAAGDRFQKYVKEAKAEADDVAATSAYEKLVKKKNELIWDGQNGAVNKKGKDALGVMQEYGPQFEEYHAQIQSELSNEDQRRAVSKLYARENLEFTNTLQKHVFTESKNLTDMTTAAAIQATQDDAILNYQNPGKVQEALARQKELLNKKAVINGYSPEIIAEQSKEEESKTHAGIVERMLANGEDLTAQKYYEQVKSGLVAPVAVKLDAAVQEGSIRGESQRQSSDIMSKYGSDQKKALEAARQIEHPRVQEETVQEIKRRFAENEQIKKANEELLFTTAANTAEKTKDRPDPSVWAGLTLQQRNAIDNRIEQLRKGLQPQTDWESFYDLRTQASTPELQDKFLQTNLLMYRSKLADSEFKELITVQTALRKGDGSADKHLDGYRTDAGIVNDTLSLIGVDPTPKSGSEDAKKVALFRRQVDQAIAAESRATGKKPSNERVQQIVDSMTVKGITDRTLHFFKTEKYKYELEPGQRFIEDVDFETIPPVAKKNIERALKQAGLKATEEEIRRAYTMSIQK